MAAKDISKKLLRQLEKEKPEGYKKKRRKRRLYVSIKSKDFRWIDRETRPPINYNSKLVKHYALRRMAKLANSGQLNFSTTWANYKKLGIHKKIWEAKAGGYGSLIQHKIRQKIITSKNSLSDWEIVSVFDKKTKQIKVIRRKVTEETKKFAFLDEMIPMTAKQAKLYATNYGWSNKWWIERYGEHWKWEHAMYHVQNAPYYLKDKPHLLKESLAYLAYAKPKYLKGTLNEMDDYAHSILLGNSKKFIGEHVPLYKVVKEIIELDPGSSKEFRSVSKWVEGHYKVKSKDFIKILNNKGKVKEEKLIDLLVGIPDHYKFVDEFSDDFVYRLGETHRSLERARGNPDPYFKVMKKKKGEGYADLFDYIEHNPQVVLTPTNVYALWGSDKFKQEFLEIFDPKWGPEAAKDWLINNLFRGDAAYKSLAVRAWRQHVTNVATRYKQIFKDPKDPRYLEANKAHAVAIREGMENIKSINMDLDLKKYPDKDIDDDEEDE